MSIILNVINYFWKIGFNEETPNVFSKEYGGGHRVLLDMASETFDYGDEIAVLDPSLMRFSQKNFVIMESLDRLLNRGLPASALRLGASPGCDYIVEEGEERGRVAVCCTIWEDEYDEQVDSVRSGSSPPPALQESKGGADWLVIYTSRLKAGLISHRCTWFSLRQWPKATELGTPDLFEDPTHEPRSDPVSESDMDDDFVVEDGVLIAYRGTREHVVVPSHVHSLANAVFWNSPTIRTVILPDGLRSMGGDTFYNCANLESLVIPSRLEVVGDNPFANCPKLELENRSPHFRYEGGLLFDHGQTRLIHCDIRGSASTVVIPDGVISVGKHAFYNCQRLTRVVLPPSLRIAENNPFSNLPRLRIENRSPHFVFQDGALYDKTMGTLFYYEQSWESDVLEIPEGVRIIGRHSFYNCRNLKSLSIPSSVAIIGYNPFAGCSSLMIRNKSPAYICQDGGLYDSDMRALINYSIARKDTEFSVPSSVSLIGRSAFFHSQHLQQVHLPPGLETIDRSAFAGCRELRQVNIPTSVKSIGEWAFSDCVKLEKLRLPEHTSIEGQTFRGSPANAAQRG